MQPQSGSKPAWKFSVALPLVEQAILAAPPDSEGLRNTSAVVDSLTALPQAKDVIATALLTSSIKDKRGLASNMVAWFAAEITKGRDWSSKVIRIGAAPSYRYRVLSDEEGYPGADVDFQAVEANPQLVKHLRRERAMWIVKRKKNSSRLSDGSLTCEACSANSKQLFSQIEGDLWEVHHRHPLGKAHAAVLTKLADLAVLCPTCHRAIHKTIPMMSVEKFRHTFFPAGT